VWTRVVDGADGDLVKLVVQVTYEAEVCFAIRVGKKERGSDRLVVGVLEVSGEQFLVDSVALLVQLVVVDAENDQLWDLVTSVVG